MAPRRKVLRDAEWHVSFVDSMDDSIVVCETCLELTRRVQHSMSHRISPAYHQQFPWWRTYLSENILDQNAHREFIEARKLRM